MKWMKSSRELTFLSTSRKLKSKHENSIIMAYGSWQNFMNSHTFLALYRVKYCSLFLKSSFSLGRLSFHFLYDGILLFFFVVHQIHRAKRPTSKLLFYTYISPFEKRKINRRFAFFHETRKLERSCHLRATITMQILLNVGANLWWRQRSPDHFRLL